MSPVEGVLPAETALTTFANLIILRAHFRMRAEVSEEAGAFSHPFCSNLFMPGGVNKLFQLNHIIITHMIDTADDCIVEDFLSSL